MKAVSEQSFLLAGPPTRKVLLHNTLAMSKAWLNDCLVDYSRWTGPACFSPLVIDYVLSDIGKVRPSIVPDNHVQEMKKVGFASNLTNVINLGLFLSGNFVIHCQNLLFMKCQHKYNSFL